MEMLPDQVYSAAEVAEYLKCSPRLVHRMAASGKIPSFPLGRLRRFRGRDILRFIEKQSGESIGDWPIASQDPAISGVHADQLYTVEEVANLLRVDVADVMSYTKNGKLPGFRVGMAWRYWGRDLLRLGHADTVVGEAEKVEITAEASPDEPQP